TDEEILKVKSRFESGRDEYNATIDHEIDSVKNSDSHCKGFDADKFLSGLTLRYEQRIDRTLRDAKRAIVECEVARIQKRIQKQIMSVRKPTCYSDFTKYCLS